MIARTDLLRALREHNDRISEKSMRELFADPDRFGTFSRSGADLFLDFSKNRIDTEAFDALIELAEASGVTAKRDSMYAGAPINATENRAVMHVALRAGEDAVYEVAGEDIMPGIRHELGRMLTFADGVRSGEIAGGGGAFTDIVNIGIGGSDLGPAMATLALAPYHDGPRVHFVSNVDGAHIADTLARLDPSRTLFLVASKTFTTVETMTNADTARRWIADALGEGAVGAHFAAMSAAVPRVEAFGIAADRAFGFGDWVGGRYSMWSTIGLPIAIAIGSDDFREMLAGARAIDEHFATAALRDNLPVILGLIGIWHRNVCRYPALAVLPYDQRLARLPAYLQQLDMESNGKRVTLEGEPVGSATGPLVFGEPGTNGQHAFYQFLHQGTDVTPCDFLVAAEGHENLPVHHDLLVAACLAQSEALMWGKTEAEAEAELRAEGMARDAAAELAPHKTFPGNRPSNTIAYRKLTPNVFGQLIALYEHKVFVQGAIWDINSFDQWGVELGKQLASGLLDNVEKGSEPAGMSGSTKGLVAKMSALRGG